MAKIEEFIKTKSGQVIVLSEGDKLVREVTITCQSRRCASRHGQEKPVEFTFSNEDFPEAGDQFMMLSLPGRSPSKTSDTPLDFCGPQCVKDYLTYDYFAPAPRGAPVEFPGSVKKNSELLEKLSVSDAAGLAEDVVTGTPV